ncbi:sortase A [Streptacidiphilus sp. MAP12-20]|uniref:sortase n=1 Tax=Streptacidiphilus sp. MAP12-20 TaxID=3156299 RepID=UPI0035162090
MTATLPAPRPAPWTVPAAPPPAPPNARPKKPARALTTAQYLSRGGLLALAALLLGVCAQLVLVSPFQERSAQIQGFDALRASLALGTAPVGQSDMNGKPLAPGTPLLLLDMPQLGLHHTVVFEGTDSDVLAMGPGHRRDTVLPGQTGVSVLMGRAGAYGRPFWGLATLKPGAQFTVTTGQGRFVYEVLGHRTAGQPAPSIPAKGSRLVLMTATGMPYLPSGVIRIDADLVSKAADTPAPLYAAASVPPDEDPLAGGAPIWWQLVLWAQALALASIAAIWCWHRWGRHQTWIVFIPLIGAVGLQVAEQVTRLLPNLL